MQTNYRDCTNEAEEDTIFVDFMEEENAGRSVYKEVEYQERAALKVAIETKLKEYNGKIK